MLAMTMLVLPSRAAVQTVVYISQYGAVQFSWCSNRMSLPCRARSLGGMMPPTPRLPPNRFRGGNRLVFSASYGGVQFQLSNSKISALQ